MCVKWGVDEGGRGCAEFAVDDGEDETGSSFSTMASTSSASTSTIEELDT